MAKTSDYRIVTFQRQPGLWRANMTPIVQPATIMRGAAIRGFVTAEDSKSEEDAVIAANRAIRHGHLVSTRFFTEPVPLHA